MAVLQGGGFLRVLACATFSLLVGSRFVSALEVDEGPVGDNSRSPFGTATHAGLSEPDLAILREYASCIGELRDAYRTLSFRAVQRTWQSVRVNGERKGEVKWRGNCQDKVGSRLDFTRFRVEAGRREGGTDDPDVATLDDVHLINEGRTHKLRLDPKTHKHFITEEGKELRPRISRIRTTEWWLEAAYECYLEPIDSFVLGDHPYSRVQSVTEVVESDTNERMVVIECTRLPRNPSDGGGYTALSSQTLTFYRDQMWALKTSVAVGVASDGNNSRVTQSCEYLPFTNAVPTLSKVVRKIGSLPIDASENDEDAWSLHYQEVVDVDELSFTSPPAANYDVATFVDSLDRRHLATASGGLSLKLFLLVNGFIFLALWYFLWRRRHRAATLRRDPNEM